MVLVEANISMSVDGYVTGPGVEQGPGLGEGGEALHAWIDDEDGRTILEDEYAAWGAVVTSRKVYEDTGGWGDDGFLLPPPSQAGSYRMPIFVVTHRPHEPVVKRAATFTFVTDGVEGAVARAVEAAHAGTGGLVNVMGGASIVRQAVDAGLVDRLRLHLAPVLLGSGTRLFGDGVPAGLRLLDHQVTAHATHLTYQVRAPAAKTSGSL